MTGHQFKITPLRVAVRLVQALLALLYVGTGLFKLMKPVATLAGMWPWAGELPGLVRATGIIDLLGGVGMLLPTLTRIRPRLVVWAALGLAALQVGAITFHLVRGEAANTPFNFALLALALFVWWGQRKLLATDSEA